MAKPKHDWHWWYDTYAARLLLYARQWLPDLSEAEDAVQAGFVKFWRSRGLPEPSDTPLLFSAVRTAALDLAKARQRRVNREQKVANDRPMLWWDSDTLADRELASAIEKMLAVLPLEQREVIVLRIWGGLTFAEVARTVDDNINTVVSRYRTALRRLRHLLPEDCYDTGKHSL